jgi:hypothetical protein
MLKHALRSTPVRYGFFSPVSQPLSSACASYNEAVRYELLGIIEQISRLPGRFDDYIRLLNIHDELEKSDDKSQNASNIESTLEILQTIPAPLAAELVRQYDFETRPHIETAEKAENDAIESQQPRTF